METFRIQTTVAKDGSVTIKRLPFRAGDPVEVIVRSERRASKQRVLYPLRGTPIRYADPYDSVAEKD
jgi:hypothetical protein